jgi:hypothetical protein
VGFPDMMALASSPSILMLRALMTAAVTAGSTPHLAQVIAGRLPQAVEFLGVGLDRNLADKFAELGGVDRFLVLVKAVNDLVLRGGQVGAFGHAQA